jgi:hypothetical protein
MTAPVHSRKVLQALVDAGVIREEDKIRRVIIDLDVGEIAKMYVERFGDERLLGIAVNLNGGYIVRYESGAEQKP